MNLNQCAIHHGTLKHLPPDEFLIKGAENNFKNFSLWWPTLDAFLNSGHKLDELIQIIEKYDLKILEISPLHHWISMTAADYASRIKIASKMCNVAKRLRAEYICVPTLGKEIDFTLAIKNLRVLADIASTHNTKIAVEFIPGEEIDCLKKAWQLIQSANKDNVGLILDTVLFCLSQSQPSDLDIIPIEKIFLVHLSDLLTTSAEIDTLTLVRNHRTFPGKGTLNLTPILTKLQQKQYKGYYALEILNEEFVNKDPVHILQQIRESLSCLK